MQFKRPQLFQHYKGELYVLLGNTIFNSEDEQTDRQPVVAYTSLRLLQSGKDIEVYTRLKSEFYDTVNFMGVETPRFRALTDDGMDMPVAGSTRAGWWPKSVPFSLLVASCARDNHQGKSLHDLAKEGGVNPYEMLCLMKNMHRLPPSSAPDNNDAAAILISELSRFK